MAASRRDLEGTLDVFLSLDLTEIGWEKEWFQFIGP
jgi:hypothetical protein